MVGKPSTSSSGSSRHSSWSARSSGVAASSRPTLPIDVRNTVRASAPSPSGSSGSRLPRAAGAGRGDDRAVGAGERLDERSRRARGVHEGDAAVAEAREQAGHVGRGQVGAGDVEAGGPVAEGAVAREKDDEVVGGLRAGGLPPVFVRRELRPVTRVSARTVAARGDEGFQHRNFRAGRSAPRVQNVKSALHCVMYGIHFAASVLSGAFVVFRGGGGADGAPSV